MKKYITAPWLVIPIVSLLGLILLVKTTKPSFPDPLWEIVHTPGSSADIMRTPVPHGWLVTYKNLARSIVYVPDENHEWKVK